MVDLVEKKIVKHVHAKHSSKDIEVLNVFSCWQVGELERECIKFIQWSNSEIIYK